MHLQQLLNLEVPSIGVAKSKEASEHDTNGTLGLLSWSTSEKQQRWYRRRHATVAEASSICTQPVHHNARLYVWPCAICCTQMIKGWEPNTIRVWSSTLRARVTAVKCAMVLHWWGARRSLLEIWQIWYLGQPRQALKLDITANATL